MRVSRKFMGWVVCCLGLLLTNCGDKEQLRREAGSSDLSGYASPDEDAFSAMLRQKFADGRSIEEQDRSFLNLGRMRTCTAVDACSNQWQSAQYDIEMIYRNSSIVIDKSSINHRQQWRINPHLNFTFSKSGLISSGTLADPRFEKTRSVQVMRLSDKNDILIETLIAELRPHEELFRPKCLAGVYDQRWHAHSYAYCQGVEAQDELEDTAPIAACKEGSDDDFFNSEEGGCYSFDLGLALSAKAPEKMQFDFGVGKERKGDSEDVAAAYCEELEESGFKGWRLPTRAEMQFMAGERARKYLYFSLTELSEAPQPTDVEVATEFWTFYEGNQPKVWTVALAEEGKSFFRLRDSHKASVLCVRKALDFDGDKVPNSSDVCLSTPKGTQVYTSGPKKGCPKAAPQEGVLEKTP